MKAKLITAGIALAASSGACAANYVAQIEVNAAGASAQLNQIGQIFQSKICAPNTAVVFDHSNTNVRGVFCTTKSDLDPGNAAVNGKTIRFNYSAIDGSASGIHYVARQLDRQFIDIDNCPTATAPATVSCTTALVNKKPVAGWSGAEPALYFGDNAPPVGNILDADLAHLNVSPSRAVIFGMAANCKLIAALQTAQGIAPIGCATPNVAATLNDGNRPSLTTARLRSLISGSVADPARLLGVPAGVVKYHRRVNGSGTQVTSNVFFLGAPCIAGAGVNLAPMPHDGATVFAHPGSGNVRDAINGETAAYALGVLSLETAPLANLGYMKIGGVSPNRANVINGSYEFFSEETFQYNPDVVSAAQQRIIELYATHSGSVDTLSGLAAAAGLAALPTAELSSNPALNAAFVMQGTRMGNNCAPQQLFD